ncbi:hypothetical protein ABEB36_009039 [Hypothenemus hampei]|uniref:Major royal jelly protein n=1 Tax=Hypothenemus hampei TaxID=57062 RepID=A0ABD1ENW6_HYPHA
MKKLFLIVLNAFYTLCRAQTETIEWLGGNFEISNQEVKNNLIFKGCFVSKNAIATRAQIYKDDIFVALPRYKPGVPATLAKLAFKSQDMETVLIPYPDLGSQEEGTNGCLQNVVDIFVDPHGILWALDVGVVNTMEDPVRMSPPKVIGFQLDTGMKLKTIDLSGLVVQGSRLQYLFVDYGKDGKPFVYILDAATRSILVYDVSSDKAYRLMLPKAMTKSRKDVLYGALLRKSNGDNILIFTYLSGQRIFSVRTESIRAGAPGGQITDLGVKNGKIVLLGTDGGAVAFYRHEGKPEIYRWNADNCTTLFPGGELVYTSPSCYLATQVLPDSVGGLMRVLESNFPDFIKGHVGCGVSQRIAPMISYV